MDIETSIKKILVDDVYVGVQESQIGLEDNLREILGLDSLGFVELRSRCAYVFGITIADEDFTPENFSSVRTLAVLVSRLRTSLPGEVRSR